MYINYDKLYPFIKISASYNFLKVLPPETHIRNIKFDHNDISDRIYHRAVMMLENRPAAVPVPLPPVPAVEWAAYERPPLLTAPVAFRPVPIAPIETNRIIGTDSQSVHSSSIQQSANKSLDHVLKYVPKRPHSEDLITEVIREYKNKVINRSNFRKFLRGISRKWAESGILVPPIREWCLKNDIHSQYGVTYKTLLKQVWAIIQDHEHKEAMKEVLFQEINDSRGVCFTGRFTRTLNALTGFIEEVKIGINSREQMQNQIAMAVKNAKDKLGDDFQVEARTNVKKILVEFEVPEVEHEAWLDAIE